MVEVEVPFAEPALTLRADPRDPGQARFLTLAIDMEIAAQTKWTGELAAALPSVPPAMAFMNISDMSTGLIAFMHAFAALCNTTMPKLFSVVARYFSSFFVNRF